MAAKKETKKAAPVVDVAAALAHRPAPMRCAYNQRDALMYAVGVGATELKFTYENEADFAVLPTYPVVLALKRDSQDVVPFMRPRAGASAAPKGDSGTPGIPKYDPNMILHAEQSIEILRPLPIEGAFLSHSRVIGVYDKGSGMLIDNEQVLVDEKSGVEYVKMVSGTFVRGMGGWNGPRGSAGPSYAPPARAPDFVVEEQTLRNQAMIYRLSGDYNPLHADPKIATAVGFPAPILHGLCTFAFAGRAVLSAVLGNQVALFKKMSVRFSSPVFPGETLVTEIWVDDSANQAVFQVKVKERNKVVISNAAVLFHSRPAPAAALRTAPAAALLPAECAATAGENETVVIQMFEAMDAVIAEHAWLKKKINCVYHFRLASENGRLLEYTVDLKAGKVYTGPPKGSKADCVFKLTVDDYLAMAAGEANNFSLLTSGRLQIDGNKMMAQKLVLLQKVATGEEKFLKSASIFEGMAFVIKQNPGLCASINRVFEIQLTGDIAETYIVDMKKGEIYTGKPRDNKKPDATFVISDDDYFDLATGAIQPTAAFMQGKLKIKGNLVAAQKLQGLQAAAAKL